MTQALAQQRAERLPGSECSLGDLRALCRVVEEAVSARDDQPSKWMEQVAACLAEMTPDSEVGVFARWFYAGVAPRRIVTEVVRLGGGPATLFRGEVLSAGNVPAPWMPRLQNGLLERWRESTASTVFEDSRPGEHAGGLGPEDPLGALGQVRARMLDWPDGPSDGPEGWRVASITHDIGAELIFGVVLRPRDQAEPSEGGVPAEQAAERLLVEAATPIVAMAFWRQYVETSLNRATLLTTLTPRQRLILPMLVEGKSAETIAEVIGRSAHTVRDHVKAIYNAWGAKSRHEMKSIWQAAQQPPPGEPVSR